jgi:signal transduction histidine kinase
VSHPGPPSPDLPLPSRNFGATRRILSIVFAASVVIPLACLIGYAYFSYQRDISDVSDNIDRLSRVAEEQAVKVMDLNQEMASRIIELLGQGDDDDIHAREATLHRELDDIGGGYPQVAAISVLGVNGSLLASSRFYPAPPVSIHERDDFLTARAIRPKPYFATPLLGRLTKSMVFNTAIGRTASNGAFLGIVMIALRQDYFVRFYQELTSQNPVLLIGLYRDDGSILARYPSIPPGANPASNTPFGQALRAGDKAGHLKMLSTVDGVERFVAYRRLGDYPLYVVAGYAQHAVIMQWWQHLALISGLTALPCIAVWLLILFSLRRLQDEQQAWERWQSEVGLRLSAEASSRHLQRMGALGNLVANVAHDFNNLLMVVSANMVLVRRKGFRDAEREVEAVERAAAKAESVARRLLSVARKQPLKQEPLDLASWLPAAEGLLQTAVGQNTELDIEVPNDIWPVFTDATEIELALINIALNARDALPPGGRFTIRCENVRVMADDEAEFHGEYVRVSLTDNGDGMSEAVAARAFEPLFTTKLSGTGTGLGLAQVLAASEQAGGTARIDSVIGEGTTVSLYLRRYEGPQVPVVPGKPADITRVAEVHSSVLVAEDNNEVAAAVAAVLETFGCSVRIVGSGDEAWEVLGSGHTFDLVLSDVQMPGKLTGIDLAEQVRATHPLQKIALMTGYADELERARHLHIPILAKPFNIDELQSLVPGL